MMSTSSGRRTTVDVAGLGFAWLVAGWRTGSTAAVASVRVTGVAAKLLLTMAAVVATLALLVVAGVVTSLPDVASLNMVLLGVAGVLTLLAGAGLDKAGADTAGVAALVVTGVATRRIMSSIELEACNVPAQGMPATCAATCPMSMGSGVAAGVDTVAVAVGLTAVAVVATLMHF